MTWDRRTRSKALERCKVMTIDNETNFVSIWFTKLKIFPMKADCIEFNINIGSNVWFLQEGDNLSLHTTIIVKFYKEWRCQLWVLCPWDSLILYLNSLWKHSLRLILPCTTTNVYWSWGTLLSAFFLLVFIINVPVKGVLHNCEKEGII